MERMQIGTFTLKTAKTYRKSSEYAAWFDDITVEPGTYPLMATIKNGKVKNTSPCVALPGIVTSANWGSEQSTKESLGTETTYHLQPYAHGVARNILTNDDSPWSLHSDFEAVFVDFEYNGEQCQTTSILKL